LNRDRLGSPVSASWNACRVSAASSSARSVTSRTSASTPLTAPPGAAPSARTGCASTSTQHTVPSARRARVVACRDAPASTSPNSPPNSARAAAGTSSRKCRPSSRPASCAKPACAAGLALVTRPARSKVTTMIGAWSTSCWCHSAPRRVSRMKLCSSAVIPARITAVITHVMKACVGVGAGMTTPPSGCGGSTPYASANRGTP
jgi:hypothetical protein